MVSDTTSSTDKSKIIYSFIARNREILAEANLDEYVYIDRYTNELAPKLFDKKPTCGWEFESLPYAWQASCPIKLQGAKFTVFEHIPAEEEDEDDEFYVWTVGCIYDASAHDRTMEIQYYESFVKHVLKASAQYRETDPVWKRGSYLAAHHQFEKVLLDMMSDTKSLQKLDKLQGGIEYLKDILENNINLVLEREERLKYGTLEKSEEALEAANVFRKNAKKLKRKMRIDSLRSAAMYGSAAAVAISAAVAVPIVLLL